MAAHEWSHKSDVTVVLSKHILTCFYYSWRSCSSSSLHRDSCVWDWVWKQRCVLICSWARHARERQSHTTRWWDTSGEFSSPLMCLGKQVSCGGHGESRELADKGKCWELFDWIWPWTQTPPGNMWRVDQNPGYRWRTTRWNATIIYYQIQSLQETAILAIAIINWVQEIFTIFARGCNFCWIPRTFLHEMDKSTDCDLEQLSRLVARIQ